MAAVNILFNYRYLGLDGGRRFEHELISNVFVVLIASLILVGYAWPTLQALRMRRRHVTVPLQHQQLSLKRCVGMGNVAWGTALLLWMVSGLQFPLWQAIYTTPRTILIRENTEFFVAQLLRGSMAASVAFLAIAYVTLRFLLPRTFNEDQESTGFDLYFEQRGSVRRHEMLLGVVPALALVTTALFVNRDPILLLSLGAMGALAYGFALYIVPKIESALSTADLVLTPTKELLRMFRQ
jgi:hypothetical protein